MQIQKIIIFGKGDYAELAYYYLIKENKYEISAFTVDQDFLDQPQFQGIPVYEFSSIEKLFPPSEYKMFIAIGYSNLNKSRAEKFNEAKKKGYTLISYISPKATTYDNLEIGENCFVFEDNTIQPFVSIGNNITMWSGNHIGHHSRIGDNCFITSHVVISGHVNIGSNCFVGVNSTIRDHISVANDCIIGAGSLLLKDTKENEVYIASRTEPSRFKSNNIPEI